MRDFFFQIVMFLAGALSSYPASASPYGVMDMAGNAREWVDELKESPAQSAALRGGAFRDGAAACATDFRLTVPALNRDLATSFRCAMDPIGEKP